MLLLLLKSAAEQIGLFEKLVPVKGTVTKTGEVRKPHYAVRHVRAKVKETHEHATGDLFAPTEHKPQTLDLFEHQPAAKAPAPAPAPAQDGIVEHVTGRGKTLRGVIRRDLDNVQALAIDPYTFKKDGGWFIREKYLTAPAPKAEDQPRPQANGDRYGTMFHGTAREFSEFDPERQGKGGARFDHQGRGIYLTDDRPGLGRFFAQTAAHATSFLEHYRDKKISLEEANALEESGGVILTVKVKPTAKILDLRDPGADAEVKRLFDKSVGDKEVGAAMRARVLALGYDGLAFDEPNRPEGWETARDATTVVVYNPDAVKITGTTHKEKGEAPAPAPVAEDGAFNPEAVPAFGVDAGVSKARRRDLNQEAIAILGKGEAPTDAERVVLAQYSGNGGCGDSLNEFYTDPKVAGAMWHVLGRLGMPAGATGLEPSCGTGVFMATAPADVRLTGVEMDPVSSQIAQLLHGDRHEVVMASSMERFAGTDGRQFDFVIGNPPYGERGALVKDDKKDLSRAELYFVDTCLDKCKSGGIVALVIPTGVLDAKSNRGFRERLLRKGEFLGAQRMPNTAFEHSHTNVTTDVVYFRKRPQDIAGALESVPQQTLKDLGVWDEEFLAGSYFSGRGAGNVLGTMEAGWRAKAGMGDDITVSGSMQGVPEALAQFEPDAVPAPELTLDKVLDALPDDDARARARRGAVKVPYQQWHKGDTKVEDGVTYILDGNPPRWHRVDDILAAPEVADAARMAGELDALMTGGAADRAQLEKDLRAYVDAHGQPSKSRLLQLAAKQNPTLYRLFGAVNPDGSLSDVVTAREKAQASSFEAAAETLALENGAFTPEQLAARWTGGSADEALDHLYASNRYAKDPAGGWTTMEVYLTGQLWPKVDALDAALASDGLPPADRDKFQAQRQRLMDTINPAVLDDVFIELNSGFLPPEVVADFFNDTHRDTPHYEQMTVKFDGAIYTVTGGPWGTRDLLDKYLNRTGVKKDDRPTLERLNREFKEWLCQSRWRDGIEEQYNRKFRGFVAKEFTNAPIALPGLNAEGLKDYQWSGLRWALDAGKGIIAADVGLGKTARALLLARAAKVTGKAQRPVIVVPKSVLANWYAETQKWFPGSNVLVIGETYSQGKDGELVGKQDNAAERARKLHALTQNDYDFVLISEPAFEEVDLNPIIKGEYVNEDFWTKRGDKLGNAGDKKLRKIRENYEQAIAKREFEKRSDAIYFDKLGIDMLIADEGHHYKNLWAARNRFGESPKFLGGQGESMRALDMNLKARFVRDSNGGNGVYMLTATPTKNSPLEIYSMLSHIAPEAFAKIGIVNSEQFIDRFCSFETDQILSTTGDIEEALVVSGFQNLDELRGIMRQYIDRTTAEDVGLKLPEKDNRTHLIDMTPEQNAVYMDLRAKAEESATKDDATGDSHIFSIMDKMNKAALDLELLDPAAHAGAESPKLKAAVTNIVSGAQEGGQVVFSDYIGSHDKLKGMLVAAGMDPAHIAIINAKAAAKASDRQAVADRFNAGKVKVVIGNTATMGEGINLQKATTDIHHLDLPWEPASMQQRNGRGVRQGNINEAVRLHTYMAKGSFDGYRFQSISAKKGWQDLLWNGGDKVENLARQHLNRDELLIMLAANPEEARAKLEADREGAKERYKAGRRAEAAGNFKRFQALRASYASLKDKKSKAAVLLASKIERAKDGLFQDKYFTAKQLLEKDIPAIIHPQTGEALLPGVGLELPQGEQSYFGGGKFVVTAVRPQTGEVMVRKYAGGGKSATLAKLEDIRDAKPFAYSEADESAELGRALEEAAKSSLEGGITKLDALHAIPSALLEQHKDSIQAQLKQAVEHNKLHVPYSGVLMRHKDTGKVTPFDNTWSLRDKVGMYDFLLPTEADREAAYQEYAEAERGKRFGYKTEYPKRGGPIKHFRPNYQGTGWGKEHVNPVAGALDDQFGKGTKRAFADRLEREQAERIRHAPSFDKAVEALLHGTTSDHAGPVIPKKVLATFWARAKRDGQLNGQTLRTAFAGQPGDAFDVFSHGYGNSRRYLRDLPLHEALAKYAAERGYKDLAAAMTVSGPGTPQQKLAQLYGHGERSSAYSSGMYSGREEVKHHPDTLMAMRHLIEKHPELAELAPRDAFGHGWAGGRSDATFPDSSQIGYHLDRAMKPE